MNTRILIMWTCVLCISLPAAGQYPLADRVPAESLVYVGWAGRSLTFDGSMVGQMLNEPALASMVEALQQAMVENIADDDSDRQVIEHAWDIILMAWQHPMALAVLPPAENGPPMPSAMLIVDLGEDRENFAEHLDGLLTASGAEIEEITVGSLTCRMIQTDGPPLVFGYVEDLLVVTTNPEMIVYVYEGSEASDLAETHSLQDSERFAEAMAAVDGEDVQVAVYVDFTALRETINGLLPPPPEEGAFHPSLSIFNSRDIDGFWRAIGLDRATAIAGTTRIVDRQLYTTFRLFSPAPHQGYLMLFAGQPITDADLAGIPADADLVSVANISPADALAEARRAMRELQPDAPEGQSFEASFDELLLSFPEQLGFSLEDDLLASLGDTWVISSAASQGGFLTGTFLSVEVTDPDKLAEVIAALETAAVPGAGVDEAGQPVPPPDGALQIRTLQAGRAEIRYVAGNMRRFPMPVAPAWAIHQDRLYVAAWPQVLATVFQRESIQPLTADADFQAYRAMVAAEPSMLCYVNTPAIVRQLYGVVLLGGTMGTNFLSGRGVDADASWVPSLAAMERYLSPEISAVSADEEGITLENVASLPMLTTRPMNFIAMAGTIWSTRASDAQHDAEATGYPDRLIGSDPNQPRGNALIDSRSGTSGLIGPD